MRILYWSTLFWPYIGGVETFCAQLGSALSRRGYEILVITSHANLKLPDAETYKGIQIRRFHFLDALGGARLDLLLKLRHQVAQTKIEFAPSLIHVNSNFSVADGFHALTANICPTPTVMTLHNEWTERSHGADGTVARTMKNSDWVVCVSQASLAQTVEVVPEIVGRSSVIYNGLDVPAILPTALPWEPPQILCLGRLSREKGFDLALTAFASIANRFPQLVIAFAGDGPERNALENQANELGIRAQVKFLGFVPRVAIPALLNESTVVLVPSRQEVFGFAALEASLMARPVVATRVGGLPEVVTDQETGILVEAENSEELAHALLNLILDPARASKMGLQARRSAREKFSCDQFVNSYASLYRRIGASQ